MYIVIEVYWNGYGAWAQPFDHRLIMGALGEYCALKPKCKCACLEVRIGPGQGHNFINIVLACYHRSLLDSLQTRTEEHFAAPSRVFL